MIPVTFMEKTFLYWYGVNLIDTAPAYGGGRAEKVVGEAIKGYDRSKLLISTKCAIGTTTLSAKKCLAEGKDPFTQGPGRDATFELDAHLTFENGGKAEIKYPHGGFGYWFDFVESGEDYVVVQFYADHGYLTHGPRVKYTFTRADGILLPACYEYLSFSDKFPAGYAAQG